MRPYNGPSGFSRRGSAWKANYIPASPAYYITKCSVDGCKGKALYRVNMSGYCRAHYAEAKERRIRHVIRLDVRVGRQIEEKRTGRDSADLKHREARSHGKFR